MKLRTILTSAALSVGLALSAGTALAHGKGMMTMPGNGQTVGADTKVMHLMFTDPMQITTVTMAAPDGKTYKINGPAANQAVKTWEGKLPKLEARRSEASLQGFLHQSIRAHVHPTESCCAGSHDPDGPAHLCEV